MPSLVQVAGTSDPYWLALQQHIEGAEEGAGAAGQAGEQGVSAEEGAGAGTSWPFEAAFVPEVLARHASAMPAFVMAGERGCGSFDPGALLGMATISACIGVWLMRVRAVKQSGSWAGALPQSCCPPLVLASSCLHCSSLSQGPGCLSATCALCSLEFSPRRSLAAWLAYPCRRPRHACAQKET